MPPQKACEARSNRERLWNDVEASEVLNHAESAR